VADDAGVVGEFSYVEYRAVGNAARGKTELPADPCGDGVDRVRRGFVSWRDVLVVLPLDDEDLDCPVLWSASLPRGAFLGSAGPAASEDHVTLGDLGLRVLLHGRASLRDFAKRLAAEEVPLQGWSIPHTALYVCGADSYELLEDAHTIVWTARYRGEVAVRRRLTLIE